MINAENLIVIVLFFSATPSIAETNDTSAVNSTAPANETAPADNATTRPEPDSVSIDFIELDPNQGCYIPGASEVNNKFQDSQDQYKTFVSVVGAKRREAQQNFTTSTIPEEVPEVERSILPNAEIITKMFPDIGDGFVVETWLASLSKITMKAMRDIKNSTATKILQRYVTADRIRKMKSKFDYSNFVSPPTEDNLEEESVSNIESESSSSSSNSTNTTEAPIQRRRKRFEITTTTLLPPRVEVIYVVPHSSGYGVQAANETHTSLNDSKVCDLHANPQYVRRKFLYFSTLFDDTLLDVTTDEFKAKKLQIETEIDDLFLEGMTESNSNISLSKGYWGANVLSLFKSTPEQLGAGRRKKRSYIDGGTGAEVELSFRVSSVMDDDVESMFIAGHGKISYLIGYSDLAPAVCLVEDLVFDTQTFIANASITQVPVGEQLYLRCWDGYVMDRKYDKTLEGLPIMCGNKGKWEYSTIFNESQNDACIKTPMCNSPPSQNEDGKLILQPYNPIDHRGSIKGGESVYYQCMDPHMLLDDNSGKAVFELLCDVSDPDNPVTAEQSTWPSCLLQPRCTQIPTPDNNATTSGLLRDVADTRTSLLPGEFVIYNCTNPTQPLSDTGSFFAIECINGALTPPPNAWPICRELSGCADSPPVPPESSMLAVIIPMVPIMELQYVNYSCTVNSNKTYLPVEDATFDQMFGVMCMPGAKWQSLSENDWPVCSDPTTTTPAPTTTAPPTRKPCYCLGDIDAVSYDSFRMTKKIHKQILEVCRKSRVTFGKNIFAKDETGAYNLLPIKEQCGVKDPYVNQYGKDAGIMRNYTIHDTCACVKNPQDTKAKSVEVVGYWMTLDITTLQYEAQNQLITLKPGRDAPSIGKKGNETAAILEKLFDDIFIDEANLVNSRYMRTRFIKFKVGNTILNQDEIDEGLTADQIVSVRVVMEVQFAKPADKSVMALDQFKDVLNGIINKNNTLSVMPMPHFQKLDGLLGIVVSNNCSDNACPIYEAPTCVNDDFIKIPEDLIFRHKNQTKMIYPYNVTLGDVTTEYVGKVGETLDFVCKADKKVFKTDIPDLLDSVLTVVCKTDRFYTVPSSGNWPICRAQCDNNVILNKLPTQETKLMLWEEHPDVLGKLDDLFWEDQKVWYKCIDEKNEGIILEKAPEGEIQYGDKKKTSLEYQCLDTGEFNLPIKDFPGCAQKPDTCECLGDMTPEQSLTVLDMMCWEDSFLPQNYKYYNHTDIEKVGLVVIATKTRCGVKKPDYPSIKDKCYCLEKEPGPKRTDVGFGVKNGFWHKMEVLSLPWHKDLFWPNTTMFQDAKRLLERELDTMYYSNSSLIVGHQYVRSMVMKFLPGNYMMSYLTSTTSTTTTTTTTSTTTTPPKRGRRNVPDDQRDYFYDNTGLKSWRDDKKVFVGARGKAWDKYSGTEQMSTQAWVEHQFVGDFSVQEFNAEDFQIEHEKRLNEINGQWMEETNNISLWLSQGCYISGKCLVEDMARCENVILESLPHGFTTLKSKKPVLQFRDSDVYEEYKTPVGSSVDIICQDTFKKITIDEVDSDPYDMKLTVMCLPTQKYDIPRENFPKCRGYCPQPIFIWNETEMHKSGGIDSNNELPLQIGMIPKRNPWDPLVGYKQLEPDNYTDLILDEAQSSFSEELWDGEKLFFTCRNDSLGVEEAATPIIAFKCRPDGTYAVPNKDEWPICKVKTTTAKPPIVKAVNFSMFIADSDLNHKVLFSEMLAAKNIGDKDLFWVATVPAFIFLLLFIVGCLFFTRNESICCQVCNRDFEIKQMQNYGHSDYHYE